MGVEFKVGDKVYTDCNDRIIFLHIFKNLNILNYKIYKINKIWEFKPVNLINIGFSDSTFLSISNFKKAGPVLTYILEKNGR